MEGDTAPGRSGTALVAANQGRQPDLLPIKWARMNVSPFRFFRGASALMAGDLATLPTTGLGVQLCGDAHVQNLGAYAAPDGHLVFDLNDFDETIPGPWEWDVKRLATSLVLAGSEAGGGKRDCVGAVRAFVETYRESMDRFSPMKVSSWPNGRSNVIPRAAGGCGVAEGRTRDAPT